MKIALISDIHNGKLIEHRPGEEALGLIRDFLEVCKAEDADCIVELGDRVNNEDHEHDVLYTEEVMSLFRSSGLPMLNVIGNHDIHNIPKDEDISLLGRSAPYFYRDLEGYRLVVLDTADPIIGDCGGCLSPSQLSWLQDLLESTPDDLPVLLFSHHPLSDQEQTGNPFFANLPGEHTIADHKAISEIIERYRDKIAGAFNGHVHWNYLRYQYDIPFFSVASLTEAYPVTEHAPGRFSMLAIRDRDNMSITSEMLSPRRVLGRFDL